MTSESLRIATRRSALAQAHAEQAGRLIARATGRACELVPMATTGDLAPTRAVDRFDTKGLFVDTLRASVLAGDCDLAVHSYKDLPTDAVEGLVIGAVPLREDPRDLLVSRDGYALASLPATATVGTSSERRRLQLLQARPGLQVLPIRGNIDTRLRKVNDGEFDAVVLALAGFRRLYAPEEAGGQGPLGLPLSGYVLEPGECLPAAAQGALAVECREDDETTLAACAAIDDPDTRTAVTAERAFLERFGGGCLAAVGALCRPQDDGALELIAMAGDAGKRRMVRLSDSGPAVDPSGLGVRLADEMRERLGR